MKAVKKHHIIIFAVLLSLIICIHILHETSKTQVYRIAETPVKYNKMWPWELRGCGIHEEEKEILIVYRAKSYSDAFACAADSDKAVSLAMEIYDYIINSFFDEDNNIYLDYNLNIIFSTYNQSQQICINCINKDFDEIYMVNGFQHLSLAQIAEHIPTVKVLCLDSKVSDIENIEKLTNLSKIISSGRLTDEEKKYILSIFPNCCIS